MVNGELIRDTVECACPNANARDSVTGRGSILP